MNHITYTADQLFIW